MKMAGRGKNIGLLLTGMAIGATLVGGTTAYAADILAERSTQPIYVDGQRVQMEAYNIGGNNYVKLRDIGQAVGFNVFWQDGVQVDSTADYTGEPPVLMDSPAAQKREDAQNVDAIKQEIIDRTNAIRRENGTAPLTASEKLTQAAQVRAEEMAATGVYSHTRPNGQPFYSITVCPYAAENIHRIADRYLAQNSVGLAQAAVDSWAGSEVHLENILNRRLSEVGIGLARGVNTSGEESWYCVQFFLYDGRSVTWVDEPIQQK